ncbi:MULTISPECIES: ROK family protein [unclassified Thermosynechococcus]|uniref:ROK family protein n=1 Tax=unclassified Thermosynechococcus TaxID=2622553 RepID=UPI00197E6383|nr:MULTISPECIES: ROK family protein [unclassified Thermosynechococcus]QSF48813.1 ROK family protein [Thermosynechococcus sp. TA-1]WNC52330.1 ROK family protein [Thermosynechococcus sp. TG215]WNC57416.1 ROK family protein [Thermosynechococcus sp. TG218]
MSEPYVIGVDLGGTAIKMGRFSPKGDCLNALTLPTPQPPFPERVIKAIVQGIKELDGEDRALAIGMGIPGPVDATGRIARRAINLDWYEVPISDSLEQLTGKPTVIGNDANCAGLGEAWLGAGSQFKDLILLTLGTGVGGAIILNGDLFVGRDGAAGELGLITLDYKGPPCNSGNRGSLEQHVSAQALRRRWGCEPHEMAERANNGDPEAIALWQSYGRELAAGIASLVYVLTPEAVIIGGGISAASDLFFPSMIAELEERVLPTSRNNLHCLRATLGNHAGIVGAAKLAWKYVKDHL